MLAKNASQCSMTSTPTGCAVCCL